MPLREIPKMRHPYDFFPTTLRDGLKHIMEKCLPFPYSMGMICAKNYIELLRTQWLSKERLSKFQNKKLSILIDHAYKNVPYYRKLFNQRALRPNDIKKVDDLRKLPILTKEAVKNNFRELTAINRGIFFPVISNTSGSTGIPLKFLLDRGNLLFETAIIARHWNWMRYSPNERQAILRGRILTSKEFFEIDGNCLRLSSFHLSPSTLDVYVDKLAEFNPALLRGYPSSLDFFARLLIENGICSIRPKAVQTSSETLFPKMRERIERAFGCKVFDFYGNGEHVSCVSECPAGGLHVNVEYGVIEFLTQEGKDARPGQIARMVCTGLNNFSMPLIRYDIGDTAVVLSSGCSCGRNLPTIEALEGRIDDFILTESGRMIPASGMTLAFEFSENIKKCQLVQPTRDELVINIVKSENYGDNDHMFMLDEVKKRVGSGIKLTTKFVEDIPRTESGKQRFMISGLSEIHNLRN